MKNNESKTTNKAETVSMSVEEERRSDLEFAVQEFASMGSQIHHIFLQYANGKDKSIKVLNSLVEEIAMEFDCFQEHIDLINETRDELYEARKELN